MFFKKSKNLKKFMQYGAVTWHNHGLDGLDKESRKD